LEDLGKSENFTMFDGQILVLIFDGDITLFPPFSMFSPSDRVPPRAAAPRAPPTRREVSLITDARRRRLQMSAGCLNVGINVGK
jgi:hypothetical protein